MGFVSQALGLGGGSNGGSNWQATGAGGAPTSSILNPADIAQAQQAYLQAQTGLGMYQNLANGVGPNVGQNMLNQATQQNIQNQGALMASQRGANANPGLIARQAAEQGAGIQQQAAGQAATMGSQQQLAGISGYNNAAQSEQQNLLNSIQGQNQANVAMQGNLNQTNAGLQNTVAQGQQGLAGGVLGGVGAGLIMSKMSNGGAVQRFDEGGMTMPSKPGYSLNVDTSMPQGPQSIVGQYLSPFQTYSSAPSNQSASLKNPFQNSSGQGGGGAQALEEGMTEFGKGIGSLFKSQSGALTTGAHGGKVIKGEGFAKQMKPVPGKAKVSGNSLKNDNVPALLSPGEVVIPRSVMQSNDPAGNAHKFVQAVMAKHNLRRKV